MNTVWICCAVQRTLWLPPMLRCARCITSFGPVWGAPAEVTAPAPPAGVGCMTPRRMNRTRTKRSYKCENEKPCRGLPRQGFSCKLRYGGGIAGRSGGGKTQSQTDGCSIEFGKIFRKIRHILRKKVLAIFGCLGYTEKHSGGKWSKSAKFRSEMEEMG